MKHGISAVVTAAVVAFALAATVAAQSKPTVKRESITPMTDVAGAANYKAYCSVCHGAGGKGDGPAAKAFTVAPADLTQISKRNGGNFPFATVKMSVTGDTVVAAHGTRDMPMWGPVFSSIDSSGQKELRVKNLVDYLESIQAK
jgi:mono/diheme cytochrome c family protein